MQDSDEFEAEDAPCRLLTAEWRRLPTLASRPPPPRFSLVNIGDAFDWPLVRDRDWAVGALRRPPLGAPTSSRRDATRG